MTIATPLCLRWEQAQHIDRSVIEPLDLGWYIVPSSRNPTGYAVHIEFDPAGQLMPVVPALTSTSGAFLAPVAAK